MITAGEVLKNKRELLKKTLEKASLDTKIQKRFLEYIENNQFDYFDSEVFLTGFIKIYAQYLDLDINKILALYRRSNPKKTLPVSKGNKGKIFKKTKGRKRQNFLNPKTFFTIFLILFLAIIVGYIGFQIYKFQSPPRLNILQPTTESEFTSEKITVKGETQTDTTIQINGTTVEVDEEKTFEKEITLKEGPNIITIKATKRNTLEKIETIRVTYTKQDAQEEDIEEIKKENIITLEIFDSPAWIRLDIDNENKLSKVVEPSKLEFTIEESMYIITGRLSNTRLLYNDQILDWQTNQVTGVVELTCQIQEDEILCD
jgi:cytoskeletal protein RodZ